MERGAESEQRGRLGAALARRRGQIVNTGEMASYTARPTRTTAMRKVHLDEAQHRLPELIDEAASGEDVVISRGDGADFRLVPVVEDPARPREFGSLKGRIHIADDFDEPLADFEPYT